MLFIILGVDLRPLRHIINQRHGETTYCITVSLTELLEEHALELAIEMPNTVSYTELSQVSVALLFSLHV